LDAIFSALNYSGGRCAPKYRSLQKSLAEFGVSNPVIEGVYA
jgi:hypothetical protein